jgi:hypothetical protein
VEVDTKVANSRPTQHWYMADAEGASEGTIDAEVASEGTTHHKKGADSEGATDGTTTHERDTNTKSSIEGTSEHDSVTEGEPHCATKDQRSVTSKVTNSGAINNNARTLQR